MTRYICRDCGFPYPEEGLPHVCPRCGGLFTLTELEYRINHQSARSHDMWKYQYAFGLPEFASPAWLGEGGTPLYELSYVRERAFFKMEHLNPSGSFKDRGTAVLTSVLKQRGIHRVVEDSSGNAGAALAQYAGAFGFQANIFIPASTSGPKRQQMETCGARVSAVEGPREAAHAAALEAVSLEGLPYASHALLPFGLAGYATIAFEIFEQLGEMPAAVYAPAGHGSLFLGILLGFQAIAESQPGLRRPAMLAVQPENCAPIYAAWHSLPFTGRLENSMAEGTMVEAPARLPEILKALRHGYDDVYTVREADIAIAYHELAAMGIYVEPTAAMVWDAWKKHKRYEDDPCVLVLSGSGLKSINQ